MQTLTQDLRHALRMMRRAPGFTVPALVTLALAVGVNTAVFTVIYGVLLRPLPYLDADRIVILSEEHPGGNAIISVPRLSNLTFDAWRRRAHTIDGLAAYSTQTFTIVSGNDTQRIDGGSLSPAAFATLAISPALGRFFRPVKIVAAPKKSLLHSSHEHRDLFRKNLYTDLTGLSHFRALVRTSSKSPALPGDPFALTIFRSAAFGYQPHLIDLTGRRGGKIGGKQ